MSALLTPLVNFEGDVTSKYYFTNPYPPPYKDEVPGYGYFYTLAAVMNGAEATNAVPSDVQGVCPSEWHVPSFAEYQLLMDYMAAKSYDPPYVDLDMPDNAVGFNLVKTGWRGFNPGTYAVNGFNYSFWTASGGPLGGICCYPEYPLTVRCVKD